MHKMTDLVDSITDVRYSYARSLVPAFVSKLDMSSTMLFLDPTHFRQIIGTLQYLMLKV
jgi:hypothetical protein